MVANKLEPKAKANKLRRCKRHVPITGASGKRAWPASSGQRTRRSSHFAEQDDDGYSGDDEVVQDSDGGETSAIGNGRGVRANVLEEVVSEVVEDCGGRVSPDGEEVEKAEKAESKRGQRRGSRAVEMDEIEEEEDKQTKKEQWKSTEQAVDKDEDDDNEVSVVVAEKESLSRLKRRRGAPTRSATRDRVIAGPSLSAKKSDSGRGAAGGAAKSNDDGTAAPKGRCRVRSQADRKKDDEFFASHGEDIDDIDTDCTPKLTGDNTPPTPPVARATIGSHKRPKRASERLSLPARITKQGDALAEIGLKKRERASKDGGGNMVSPVTRAVGSDAGVIIDIDSDDGDVASRPTVGPREPSASLAKFVTPAKWQKNSADDPGPSTKRRSSRQAKQQAKRRSQEAKDNLEVADSDSARLREAEKEREQTAAARTQALVEAEQERVRDEEQTKHELELAKLSILPNRELFLYPPNDARGRVAITSDDSARLNPGCYLNDSLVDFYIKHIDRVLAPQRMTEEEPLFCFSSFFFGRLRQAVDPIDYAGVQRWTKYANDLFSKRFVFVPVCDSHHWSLIVVANLDRLSSCIDKSEWEGRLVDRPTVLYIDSLSGGTRGNAFAKIMKSYLAEEWLFRKEQKGDKDRKVDLARAKAVRRSIDFIVRVVKPRVPLQTNEFDCGLYLLWNIVEFIRNRDGFRERCLDRKGASDHNAPSLGRFYNHSTVLTLRADLKRMVDRFTPVELRGVLAKDIEERDARVNQYKNSVSEEGAIRASADVLRTSRQTAEDEVLARAIQLSQEEVFGVATAPAKQSRGSDDEAALPETECAEIAGEANKLPADEIGGGYESAVEEEEEGVLEPAVEADSAVADAEKLVSGNAMNGDAMDDTDDLTIPLAGRCSKLPSPSSPSRELTGTRANAVPSPAFSMVAPAPRNNIILAVSQSPAMQSRTAAMQGQTQPSRTRRLSNDCGSFPISANGAGPMEVPDATEGSQFPVTHVASMDVESAKGPSEDDEDDDDAMEVMEEDAIQPVLSFPMETCESIDADTMKT